MRKKYEKPELEILSLKPVESIMNIDVTGSDLGGEDGWDDDW